MDLSGKKNKKQKKTKEREPIKWQVNNKSVEIGMWNPY